jgi:RNA recognition motif-containing protein
LNIYVGNLPLDINEDEVREQFATFGTIVSVRLMNDGYIGSGHPRAYGYVEMASMSEGEAAIIGLKGKIIRNQVLEIIGALPLSNEKNGGLSTARKISKYSNRKGRQRTC